MSEHISPVAAPLELDVRGRPIPKGSVTAFAVKNKNTGKYRGVVVHGGKTSEARATYAEWSDAIRTAAARAMGHRDADSVEVARFVACPVAVEITFRLARPKGHFGTGRNAGKLKPDAPPFPTGAPDVDKLARAVLDALIGTAFDDDSRVVDLHPTKVYSSTPGATIRVRYCDRIEERLVLGDSPDGAASHTLFEDPNMRDESTPATPELDAPPPPRPRKTQQERVREIIGGTQIEAELGVYGARILREVDTRPCDGDHPLPRCSDPECWRDDASFAVLEELVYRDPFLRAAVADRVAAVEDLDSVIARGDRAELARRMLAAPSGSLEERRCFDALSASLAPVDAAELARLVGLEDDFG